MREIPEILCVLLPYRLVESVLADHVVSGRACQRYFGFNPGGAGQPANGEE